MKTVRVAALIISILLLIQCEEKEFDKNFIVPIQDQAFLDALINEGVDTNGDNLISYSEAEVITSLDVSGTEISDLTGINAFVNLIKLNVNGECSFPGCWDGKIKTLDLSNNTKLQELRCMGNQLSSLDISTNTALKTLILGNNPLRTLDVSNNTALQYLWVNNNQLTALNVSKNISLVELYFFNYTQFFDFHNQLNSLDISNNRFLTKLIGYNNQNLTEICVWQIPLPVVIDVNIDGCPNAYFTTECN